MKLDINFRNMRGSGDLISYIDHRLSFAFSRIRHKIESVSITLTDINGPKAGVDKQCRVIIRPIGLKQIVVTEKRDDILSAVDRSIARSSQSLFRKLKRQQVWKRKTVYSAGVHSELSPVN